MEKEKIQNWKTPKWHKDFGDPRKELSLLKNLCLFILKLNPYYSFEIEYIEEGYMAVNIYKEGKYIGECQVVDQEINKIGLFLESGKEIYIFKKEDIKKHI